MKRIGILLAVTAILASMTVPSVFACYFYTPGYWKHNVTVYYEDRRPNSYAADIDGVKESDALMEAYATHILTVIDPPELPADVDTVPEFLEWAYNQFWMRGPGRQPIRQMIADWFNYAKDAVP